MFRLCLLSGLIFLSFCLRAQDKYAQQDIQVKYTSEQIVLDGVLNEAAWYKGIPAKNFWSNFPSDSVQSEVQTEIYMTYDDNNLYIAAKCQSIGEDYIISSLKRDFRAGGSDNLTFMFDPFNDKTNAFVFGINPYGVLREALIFNGGVNPREDFDESWDNKWSGEAKIHEGYWTAELAIPFSTLRFNEGATNWNFQSYRFDTQSNTRSIWMRVPRNQGITNLGFMGKMVWEKPLKKTSGSVSLIPYTSGSIVKNIEDQEDTEFDFGFGGDAKIAVTPGLNLDLTINPDFSQVEVDRQVTNLDRFEIFFPERRQFFLENSDLFGSFGNERINPFFSRRIGVARDTSTGSAIANPILAGARLSGKLDNNWRVGFLNMQTAKNEENGLPSFNYTVAALQRKVFKRSNVGLIFVNKQTFQDDFDRDEYNEYNRVVGLDYNLNSADNAWTGKLFYHRSLGLESLGKEFAHGARLRYTKRKYSLDWNHQWVGENYDAEVGFVPRRNFFKIEPEARLYFYNDNGRINQHGPGMQVEVLWTPGQGRTDHSYEFFYDFSFTNSSRGRIGIANNYTYLFEDFDPTRVSETAVLPAETAYNYTDIRGFYSSDRRKKLSFFGFGTIGEFYNGKRASLRSTLTYRYQPFGAIALSLNYNYLDLPEFEPTSLFLIGPRIDFTFSKSIFLTTFIQYNDQIDNINVNARFQWRFAPVSDFFLVYTDNYYASDLKTKNRAIIAKLTYWLNI